MTREAFLFLNDWEARMIEALCARILPGDDADPGAVQAGATCYIDRTLAGHHHDLQPLYRAGLAALEERSRRRASGATTRTSRPGSSASSASTRCRGCSATPPTAATGTRWAGG
jgi:hypothetical protein